MIKFYAAVVDWPLVLPNWCTVLPLVAFLTPTLPWFTLLVVWKERFMGCKCTQMEIIDVVTCCFCFILNYGLFLLYVSCMHKISDTYIYYYYYYYLSSIFNRYIPLNFEKLAWCYLPHFKWRLYRKIQYLFLTIDVSQRIHSIKCLYWIITENCIPSLQPTNTVCLSVLRHNIATNLQCCQKFSL